MATSKFPICGKICVSKTGQNNFENAPNLGSQWFNSIMKCILE
jgi:hypothetical protein